MNLFALYEKLENICREFVDPRKSSVYSARTSLDKFLQLMLNTISESVYKEYHAEKSFSQLLVYNRKQGRVSPETCRLLLEFWDNEKKDIYEYFAIVIMFFLEAIKICGAVSDNMAKYIGNNKLTTLCKHLCNDLIEHGGDAEMINGYYNRIEIND